MPPTSQTLVYDALLSTTLFNYRRKLEDTISKTNAVLFYLMNKAEGAYQKITDLGDRMQLPLMYELGNADAYSGYDVLDTTPMDGVTSAFYQWRQAAVPISISGLEEKKNTGEARILGLLETKTKQAEMGIREFFNHRMLVGAGGATITTAYTSPMNGSSFLDPLPHLVRLDPTSSVTIGEINQSTNLWWRNQFQDFVTFTTYAAQLTQLRKLRVRCGRGPGGFPDLHFTDENVYSWYEAALAAQHRNPSYQRADIPFDNIMFYGSPVTYDERVPNVKDGAETVDETDGTWYMLNSQFFGLKVHSETNFHPTPFTKPENQDAKTAHILWLGGIGVSNRRKHGVAADIDSTVAA